MADKDQPATWGQMGRAAKVIGRTLTFLPRMSAKIATGEISKTDSLPQMLGKMKDPEMPFKNTPTGELKILK